MIGNNKVIATLHRWLPFMICLAGVLLRAIYLGVIPGGYQMDEAYAAWNAWSLYKDGIDSAGHSYPVYFEAWAHGQNALNSYLMLPWIYLTGEINSLIVRLPQVIVSSMTLVAVYVMMKKMYGRETGIWALFLLAICPWHMMMSRWGLESNLAPGFLMLGLCFWILGLEKPRYLLLSALAYGLSLYCYATIWPIVPVMIVLQMAYCLWYRKVRLDRWLLGFLAIVVALGLPLLLFLLVNMGWLPEFQIGCFSVYKMTMFRGNELAGSLADILNNIRNVGYLLLHQDVGRPYDVIMPYGFFYDMGRIFIVIGVPVVLYRTVKSLVKREFAFETFLVIQLIGAGIVGCLIKVGMTQINCLYIPLVLCEAIGVWTVCQGFRVLWSRLLKKDTKVCPARLLSFIIAVVFSVLFVGFQREYYTDYRQKVSAYFQEGSEDAINYALEAAKGRDCAVRVNSAIKYPNVLLATRTGAQEYLDTLVYSEQLPAPSQFDCEEITFYMGIDYEHLSGQEVYVIYFNEIDLFADYTLTGFQDWYVAVPKSME